MYASYSHVWRQPSQKAKGFFVTYEAKDVSPEMSFLEMLDVVNEDLTNKGEMPIAFDHDCREGICGMCGLMINGVAHGPSRGTATCQLHMRSFKDGETGLDRAVAFDGLPGAVRSRRGPRRTRSDHPSGRVHQREYR